MQKLILILCAMTTLLLVSWGAKAEKVCQADRDSYDVDLQTVIVPANAEIGDVVKVVSNTVNVTCGDAARDQQISRVGHPNWVRTGIMAHVDGINCPVLDTDMGLGDLGLGIVWTNYNSAAGTWGCMSNYFPSMNVNGTKRGLSRNRTSVITDNFYIIKTKKDIDYGKKGEIEQSIYLSEADKEGNVIDDLYNIQFYGDIQLSRAGCTIETNKDVQMGSVPTKMFRGIGTTGPRVPFSIVMSECHGNATHVLMHLEPTYGYADKNNGVIALSKEEGSASGVGIQLRMDDKIIDASANPLSYPFQQGTTILSFNANYYQVDEHVQPGTVNSTLIFYTYYD